MLQTAQIKWFVPPPDNISAMLSKRGFNTTPASFNTSTFIMLDILPPSLAKKLPLRGAILLLGLSLSTFGQTESELIAKLDQSFQTGEPSNIQRSLQILDSLKASVDAKRWAEADLTLNSLRSFSATTPNTALVIEQLRTSFRAKASAAQTQRDAALDSILTDTVAKLAARAPLSDFDALLNRFTPIPVFSDRTGDSGSQKIEMARSFVARCQDFLANSTSGNYDAALNSLNEALRLSATLPAVSRSKLLAVQADLSKKRSAGSDPQDERIEVLKKQIDATIASSKTAADLDALLLELGKPVRNNNASGNNQVFELMRRFVRRWQDYVNQVATGNNSAAFNTLRELANDNTYESFYPRSRILARMETTGNSTPAASGSLLAPEALTIDNLEQFARQISARRSGPYAAVTNDPANDELAQEVARVHTALTQFQLGNPHLALAGTRTHLSGRVNPYSGALARVQQSLLLRVLPAYVQAPDDLKPLAGETPEVYLRRVVKHGSEKKDWALAVRSLEAIQSLINNIPGSALNADLNAYRQLLVATNQERAEQWTAAIRSYLNVLRAESGTLPVDEIGRRLKALKAAHPQEYQTAEAQPEPAEAHRGFPVGYIDGRTPPNRINPLMGQDASITGYSTLPDTPMIPRPAMIATPTPTPTPTPSPIRR